MLVSLLHKSKHINAISTALSDPRLTAANRRPLPAIHLFANRWLAVRGHIWFMKHHVRMKVHLCPLDQRQTSGGCVLERLDTVRCVGPDGLSCRLARLLVQVYVNEIRSCLRTTHRACCGPCL